MSYAEENGIQADTYEKLVETEAIQKLIENEVAEAVNSKNGFKAYERINKIALITKPFEVGVEMSAKQEIMRYRIAEIYKDKIAKMYAD